MQLTLSFAVTLLFRPTQLSASQHWPLSLINVGARRQTQPAPLNTEQSILEILGWDLEIGNTD